MKIHALTTGTVRVKHSFLYAAHGPRRQQLRALRADAIGPDPKVHVATLETIMAHCAQHATIYLPSHDPESAARLAGAVQAADSVPAS